MNYHSCSSEATSGSDCGAEVKVEERPGRHRGTARGRCRRWAVLAGLFLVCAVGGVVLRSVAVAGALREAGRRESEARKIAATIQTSRDVEALDQLMGQLSFPKSSIAPLASVGEFGVKGWEFRKAAEVDWAGEGGKRFFIPWCTKVYVLVRLGASMGGGLSDVPIEKGELEKMVSVVRAKTLERSVATVGMLNLGTAITGGLALLFMLLFVARRGGKAGQVPEETFGLEREVL